jgi:hypothetical protein
MTEAQSRTLYTAREKFDSSCGDDWKKYLEFLGRDDLTRVVTLDAILCPSVIEVEKQEDWDALPPDAMSMNFFFDLGLVQRRAAAATKRCNVLAVIKEPRADDVERFAAEGFEFAGFDIVDKGDEVSAILNCGGFPESFSNSELSHSTGLIQSIERAYQIRDDLANFNPDEYHADCNVWAVWIASKTEGEGVESVLVPTT